MIKNFFFSVVREEYTRADVFGIDSIQPDGVLWASLQAKIKQCAPQPTITHRLRPDNINRLVSNLTGLNCAKTSWPIEIFTNFWAFDWQQPNNYRFIKACKIRIMIGERKLQVIPSVVVKSFGSDKHRTSSYDHKSIVRVHMSQKILVLLCIYGQKGMKSTNQSLGV